MATIQTANLIAKFQYALDNKWGYILNTWHTLWTKELQDEKVRFMKKNYGEDWINSTSAQKSSSYTAARYGAKWIGSWVTDCSGLFYWAFKELGGYMYHGSNTMWNKYCVSKGKLSKGKRTDGQELKPGTAVFVLKNGDDRSHVGLYIGNGLVIEASGTQSGVITTKITNTKWCEWGELKGVNYVSAPSTPAQKEENKVSELVVGSAVVNAEKVALRKDPSTQSSVLTRVDKGERVQVLPNTDDWLRVSYQGKVGYMMKKFLTQ